jgi:flagellar basal body rod protein FlgG
LIAWFFTLVVCFLTSLAFADPQQNFPIKYAKKPYAELYEYHEPMQRDYRLLKEGMRGQLENFKAHMNAVLFINTPGYKRYKFVSYLHDDNEIVPIQYIDWGRVPPTLSHRPLDFYVSGKYNMFCLEPQNDVPFYTFDGRFYVDTDGLLRTVAHHLPVLGEDGYIYLSTNDPDVDQYGRIYEDNNHVATLKIQSFK